MERPSRCELCSSSNDNLLVCNHRQYNSNPQHFHEQNIQCDLGSILHLMSDVDVNTSVSPRFCDGCRKIFNSNIEYGQHKRKVSCILENYGCLQQIGLCSINQHYADKAHVNALIEAVKSLQSPFNIDLIEKLTRCFAENNNEAINDAIYFDDISVLTLNDLTIDNEIDNDDKNQLTNEQREILLENYLVCGEQNESIINSRINQLDSQENNQQQQQTIDHSTEINALTEKLNKLSTMFEQTTQINQCLNIDREMRVMELSNVSASNNGLFIWIIENISDKIGYSYSHPKSFIDSPRFSSLTGEHPLSIRLFLHGDDKNYPKYISIYITLSFGGNNDLSIPLTCCLVDQTNNHRHLLKHAKVDLNQYNVGHFCKFCQFIPAIEVHEEASRFVKNGNLCLIVKLHEDQSDEYKHYEIPIQHAVQQINSLTFS